MNIMITGATGFVGSHLVEFYLNKFEDIQIIAIRRTRCDTKNVDHINDKRLIWEFCDLLDKNSIESVVSKYKIDICHHLAALSYVKDSWNAPTLTLKNNIEGECNLFEAFKKYNKDAVIQIAGSSEEYGMVYENEVPIKETNPVRPLSPYGVSKVGQTLLGYQYAKSYDMKIVCTRTFNHSGPRRGEMFADSNFAKQIAMIEKKIKDPIIKHGNLDSIRDLSHVSDIIEAYYLSTQYCKYGVIYNICSGSNKTIEYMLNKLISLSDTEIKTEFDITRNRPSDVPVLIGDNAKFCSATGWYPKKNVDDILVDVLSYWRKNI